MAQKRRLSSIFQKETFKSIRYVTIGKIGSTLLGLATIALSARGLGVQDYGKITLFLSFVELANLLALPGFNTILQKSIHHKRYQFYKKAFKYTFLSSIFLGITAYFSLIFINDSINFLSNQTKSFIPYVIIFISLKTFDKSEVILPALKKFKSLAIFTFLSSLSRFCALGIGSIVTHDLFTVIKLLLASQFILGIISFSCSYFYLKGKTSTESDAQFIRESIQMSLLAFLNTGIGQLDKFLLYNLSASTLGVFQAGASYPEKFREVIKTILMTITNIWLSFGNKEFTNRTSKNIPVMVIVFVLGGSLFYILPEFYIPLLLGDKFSESIPIASYMGVIIFIKLLNYFFQSRDIVFESIKRHQGKIILYRLVYIVLLFILIEKYGIYGVIITVFFSESLYLIMLIVDFAKSNNLRLKNENASYNS